MLRVLAVLVGLGLATVIFYPEIALTGRILADYDVWTYFYPLRQYGADALKAGRFPLWNPDTFLGAPFFANPQTSLLYPGTLLFLVLPVPDAYTVSVLLHVFLTAAAAHAFMRVVLGVRTVPGLLGAFALAFGGAVSAQIGHINQLSATPWLLVVAVCTDLAFRRRSLVWLSLGAMALGIQLLAGHAQIAYMTAWVVGILLLWRVVEEVRSGIPAEDAGPAVSRWRTVLRGIGIFALMVLPGAAVAAAQLVPTAELSGESVRSGGLSFPEAVTFSLPPDQIARALLPGYWANVYSEFMGYVGTLPLFLAILALAFAPGLRVLFALLVASLGLALALGGANPLYGVVYEVVPGIDLFRVPARWLLVYSLGVAALAALGGEWILDRPLPTANVWRPPVVLGIASLIVVLFTELVGDVPDRIVALWMCGFIGAGVVALLALRRPGRAVSALLVLGCLAELRATALDLPARNPVPAEAYTTRREVPSYLAQAGQGRLLSIAPTEYEVPDSAILAASHPNLGSAASLAFKTALKLDEVMSPNVPLRFGLSTVDGYDGGVLPLRRYLEMASLLVPRSDLRSDGVLRTRLLAVPEPALLDLFRVRAVIANQVNDIDIDGVRFDTSTARRLVAGAAVTVDLSAPLELREIALLASTDELSTLDTVGTVVLERADGSREEVPLLPERHVFARGAPGPLRAARRVIQPGQSGGEDTAVRIGVAAGEAVTRVTYHWNGPGVWELRGAVLVGTDGRQEQLVLLPEVRRTLFPVLKVYEPTWAHPAVTDLVLQAETVDDERALAGLRAEPASPQWLVRLAEGSDAMPQEGAGRGRMLLVDRSPERLGFERVGSDGAGYLVVDDAWVPGWRAWIDDEEVRVQRANVLFKAVWVPSGAQKVVLSYEPNSVKVGFVASALGVLAIVVLLVLGLRGRRL